MPRSPPLAKWPPTPPPAAPEPSPHRQDLAQQPRAQTPLYTLETKAGDTGVPARDHHAGVLSTVGLRGLLLLHVPLQMPQRMPVYATPGLRRPAGHQVRPVPVLPPSLIANTGTGCWLLTGHTSSAGLGCSQVLPPLHHLVSWCFPGSDPTSGCQRIK